MKSFFINAKEKKITEILLAKESESNLYLVKIWDTIRLLLDTEFVDGMPYNDDGYIFYKQQQDSHGFEELSVEGKYWIKVEGIDETKIVYGNSLLIFPNGQSNGERINQGGLVEGSAFKITFLDDYERPAQDFEL